MIKMKSKRGQHEILGFVIIVVIVAVIGVIFLGLSLRKPAGIQQDDAEISNFLSASMGITSDCVLREPLFAEMEDLIGACRGGKSCGDGRSACDVLNSSYEELLAGVWPAAPERPIKYTKLEIFYQLDITDPTTREAAILEIKQGSEELCIERRAGQQLKAVSPGNIITRMEICRSAE